MLATASPLNGLMDAREFYMAKPWIRQEDWGSIDGPLEKMPDFNLAKWAWHKLQTRHAKPRFLAVGFFRPHMPWHVPRKYFPWLGRPKASRPTNSSMSFRTVAAWRAATR
jgi:hypothetical protein